MQPKVNLWYVPGFFFFGCFKKRSSRLEKHPLRFFIVRLFHFCHFLYGTKNGQTGATDLLKWSCRFLLLILYFAASNKRSPPGVFIPPNIKGENSHERCSIPGRQKALGLKCVISSRRWLAYKNTKLSLSVYWLTHLFE